MIELAIVLVIIGLLVGGGIVALTSGAEQARRTDQKRQFEHVREALYGYAIVHGRLPCADTDGNGRENRSGAGCDDGADHGALPSADLAVSGNDAWGYPLYYAVTPDYAEDPGTDLSSFTLDPNSKGRYTVYDHHETGDADTVAYDIPAIVLSFGPQGGQVWVDGWASGEIDCPGQDGSASSGFSDNETANCDGTVNFVSAGFATPESGARFDDMVMWLSDSVLKARMLKAGKLP